MAFPNFLFVIILISFCLSASQLFLCTGASSLNANIRPSKTTSRCIGLARKFADPSLSPQLRTVSRCVLGRKFADPSLGSQLRTVPVTNELCSLKDLSFVSSVVREDSVLGEVTNNCKYCQAVYNIIVDCSPVKAATGGTCKQPPNYALAYQEKWKFPYHGKPTALKILSADFKNCQ